jgi:hypothetical protein
VTPTSGAEWPVVRIRYPGLGQGRCAVCGRRFDPGQAIEGCGSGAGDGRDGLFRHRNREICRA